MKIKISLFLLILLWIIPVTAQNKKETDSRREGLSGTVKKLEAYLVEFLLKDGRLVEAKRPWFTNQYSVEGELSERIGYNEHGAISGRYVYTFDEKGRNTGYKEFANILSKNLTVPRKHIYTLDENGNTIEYSVFDSDGTRAGRFVNKYDEKGNIIEERHYYHTGAIGGKTISTYNENGKLTGKTYLNSDGNLTGKISFIVDGNGQIIEETRYQGETLKYKMFYKYDLQGRILEKETLEFNAHPNGWTSHSPEPGKVVYIYDDEKKTKEIISFDPDGLAKDTSVSVFNDKAVEIEVTTFKSGGSYDEIMSQAKNITPAVRRKLRGTFAGKIIYQYEYDAQGNWIKKTRLTQSGEMDKPKPSSAELRIIDYY